MDIHEIPAEIKKLGKELKKHKQLMDVEVVINRPVKQMFLKDLPAQQIFLPEEVLEFYKLANGFSLRWKLQGQDQQALQMGDTMLVAGESVILTFEETFLYSWRNKLWIDEPSGSSEADREYDELSKQMRGFDAGPEILNNTQFGAFLFDKKRSGATHTVPMPIWYWNTVGGKFQLDTGFETYLSRIIETRGFINWQAFFIDFNAMDFSSDLVRTKLIPSLRAYLTGMELFLEQMPVLFPETDLSDYRLRFENFNKQINQLNYP